jgi:predicted O-linked N-acetylglucosamine transferase (SPINDLY family)
MSIQRMQGLYQDREPPELEDPVAVASRPGGAASWLNALLAAYSADAPTQAPIPAVQDHLRHIDFEAIVSAIERDRAGISGLAGIRLYQHWIEANARTTRSLLGAWFNLGVALAREGDPAAAAAAYDNALGLMPDFYPAAFNLGLTFETMGQTDAALQTWERATQPAESRIALLTQRARLHETLGHLERAESILRASLLTNPSQPGTILHRLHLRQQMCQWPILTTDIPSLTAAEVLRQSGPSGVFTLTDDINIQHEVARSWIMLKMPAAPTRLSPPEGYRHDRVRLGYIFCNSGRNIAGLAARHDRGRFDIFGYCAATADDSDMHRRAVASFDHLRIIRELSDEQSARLIRDDEIDILIDLDGLSAHTRLAVLRWRPAPIQATYPRSAGPVPLPELDYLLCDDFVVPPAQTTSYRPRPLHIAPILCGEAGTRTIGRELSRREAGLPEDRFVLCCFSRLHKITEAMFAAWMSIMDSAERTVLWLAADNQWAQANLRAAAVRANIAPERIIFAERTSAEVYMARLGLADLLLDTFPCSSATIAKDAMQMQLPLITLCGASFASRRAASLLNAIGAQQGITTQLSEYIATATGFATDPLAYADYRVGFSADAWGRMAGGVARFMAEFEAILVGLSHDARAPVVPPCAREQTGPRTAAAVPPDRDQPMEPEGMGLFQLVAAAETTTAYRGAEAASDLYERWLSHNSTDRLRYVAHYNRGILLYKADRTADAVAAYEEAIRIAPDFLPSYVNAGLGLERQGCPERAVAYWRQAAARLVPTDRDAVCQKATALKHVGRVLKSAMDYQGAETALGQSLAIDPHQRDTAQHWVALRQMQCKWPVLSAAAAAGWDVKASTLMSILQPLSVAIHTDDPLLQLAAGWRCFKVHAGQGSGPGTAGRWPAPASWSPRPLRIGYVSADLRDHAIGFLTAEVFELHNRTRVEVFAYNCGPIGRDVTQARIRGAVDHWTEIGGWDDKQAARCIVRDQIDILVDLGGHTSGAPAGLFALRPAPVIVNWLGYPGSMGTPHHQYIIADEEIIPPAYEKFYSERVLRLPCYQPTDRNRVVAGLPPSRQEAGLPEGAMVYCCFNGTQKITSVLFERWMAILAQVPDAVLWLLSCDGATDNRLREEAMRQGIAAERLVFAARKPNPEHLARYPLADLFLDTWPYGAHTTASDALWMGVPAITMTGHGFASRVCGSLVRAAGLHQLVCDNPEAYVRTAVHLGTHPDALRAVRDKLRSGRDGCTLFAMPLLVASLESLYDRMWNEYRSGQIAEPNLTNLDVYDEIGCDLDHDRVVFPDLASYERRYMNALSYRDSLSRISADGRLWTG